MTYSNLRRILLAGAALSLAACGGSGGGSGVSSTPAPIPPPATTSSAVDIFQSPATQEFAAIGSGNSLRIRYDAATNKYEVMAEGRGWETLVDSPSFTPHPGDPNVIFVFAGAPTNSSYFMIRAHYSYPASNSARYQYSNLAPWRVGSVSGYTAFGMATPASGVPVTGSASYQGMIEGGTTETYSDGFEIAPGYVAGSINLSFDFGSGSLSGSISPTVYLAGTHVLPALTFTDTVYSTGSASFSGRFSTSLAGPNSFAGLFTGPAAQELIGRFEFPYSSPVDGGAERAAGAFVAKRP